MKTDPCRFCRLYALALGPIAAALGLLLCAQISIFQVAGTMSDGSQLLYELAAGAGLTGVLRSVAPAATGSALSIALVAWAHPLAEGTFRSELGGVLKRGALVTPLGYVVASILGGLLAVALGPSLFRIPASVFTPDAAAVRELSWGLVAAGIDSALVSLVAWRFLGAARGMKLSLAGMLVVACTAVFPLRALVGLVLESLLPG